NKQEYHTLYPDIHRCQFSHKWVDKYIEEQQSFLSFILYRQSEHNYSLNLIGNMDETPIAFNIPNQTTVEESEKKTISILTTGYERTCFTVTLACLADGTKLPPFIIFKLVNVPRERFPNGHRQANLGSNPRSLLVLDAFAGHKTDLVKRRIRERNTDIAVILNGLTSHLQPLDMSLNKSFKAK
ncbi:9817_t:CDS:2, partial [Scutellospora calospora]